MSVLRYAWRELAFRRSRSLIAILSFAIAVLTAVLLTALAASYARAVRAPIETVGADVIVQITGDIPPKLEGLVFPHPNALVPAAAVAAVRAMQGVISLTRGVYMWELAPDHYQSILGIDDSEAGLGSLASRLIDGKPLGAGDQAVLLDSDFATKQNLKVGASIGVGGTKFPVRGIVDAARGGKVVRADVYMALTPAQALAATAPMVQALYPFGRDDANLLLVKVDRQHLEGVVDKVATLLGKKGIVSSELSFREALSGVLFLSQRMGLIVAAVIGAFAAAFVFRATASAIQERRQTRRSRRRRSNPCAATGTARRSAPRGTTARSTRSLSCRAASRLCRRRPPDAGDRPSPAAGWRRRGRTDRAPAPSGPLPPGLAPERAAYRHRRAPPCRRARRRQSRAREISYRRHRCWRLL